jgi:hypothetical protein
MALPNIFTRQVADGVIQRINNLTPATTPHTAPAFIITTEKEFNKEKDRLTSYISRTQQLGEKEFDGKPSLSFGPMTTTEWNNMFYKHLDHHLTQFGV